MPDVQGGARETFCVPSDGDGARETLRGPSDGDGARETLRELSDGRVCCRTFCVPPDWPVSFRPIVAPGPGEESGWRGAVSSLLIQPR